MDNKSEPGLDCFVCRSNLNPSRSSLGTHKKLTEGQRIFILELVGFSTTKNEPLCRSCIVLVKKGMQLKNEIQKLEEKLEKEVRSVILKKFMKNRGSQGPCVSLPKSKIEQKPSIKSDEGICFPLENELNLDLSAAEGLIDSEDIKIEVDLTKESHSQQQPTEIYLPISDPPPENDSQCEDEGDPAEKINFEEPEEEQKKKISKKRSSSHLPLLRADSSEEESYTGCEGMSEPEEIDCMDTTPARASTNAPIEDKLSLRVEGRPPKTNYKYDCPSPLCPKVKNYTYNDFAQHLRFHKRRPYRCKLCCEFILEDQSVWKDHLRNHPEVGETPAEEIIIKEDIKSGNVFHCSALHKCGGFPTEKERDEHEMTCQSFKRKRRKKQCQWNQIVCTMCHKDFRNSNEWRFHRVLEHPEEDWMRCPFCDESFKEKTVEGVEDRNDEKLFEHIGKIHRSEKDVFSQMKLYDNCETCGLLFTALRQTAEHFRDKHGFKGELKDWVYPCRICNKEFGTAMLLRRHMSLVHFRPEGIVCDLCGATFTVQNTLIEHKFSRHQINEDNLSLITCPEQNCEFQCFFSVTMRSHCEQHRPREKICEICGKGFKRGPDLNRHKATHSTSVNN